MLKTYRQQREKLRVGEVLIQKGLITPAQLSQALSLQHGHALKLGEILVQEGLVTEQELQRALFEQRWRNWVATAMLSLSTVVTAFPKVAVANPNEGREANHRIDTTLLDSRQGGASGLSAAGAPTRQPMVRKPEHLRAPLSRTPTVASPLVGFCHPLNGQGWLSQGTRGTTHQGRMEFAYDFAASIGTPIYAMRAGRVLGVRDKYPDTGGGRENAARFNYVWLEHDGGYRSAYVHLQQGFLSRANIKAGDWVEAGQLIGYTGNSGWSTGPHLHVEVQEPSSTYGFNNTVPFAISLACEIGEIAKNPFTPAQGQ
ncbi:peptidoglycan DD-metalloendopeptidase family protein [Synechococcales cyanobacterium C]|uniref:Peptidoglycan DD-metalloendopeptidase family protein n=1 Tax=Petrachloros mirabilis ULC683 TaxID=2781853 RepID=A0A8K1ZWL2_9CYAN|nr:M23 family metallopeptidase [Petrachloros mirabilis]NCJ05002.1 peptidoglycan DD-metalloendopeptidase family protein [Petrachloros mirabilis ULC683]